MSVEIVTKEDLQIFRMQLLDDLKKVLAVNNHQHEPEVWLRSGEIRKVLKVSPGTLQNLRISGKLKPVKIGGTWYYNAKELKELFK